MGKATTRQLLVGILSFTLFNCAGVARAEKVADGVAKVENPSSEYAAVRTLSLKQSFGCKKDWHVTYFEPRPIEDKEGLPVERPSLLSFWTNQAKQNFDSHPITSWRSEKCVMNFQELGELKIVNLAGGKKGLQLFARNKAVSGYDPELLEFWEYDGKSDSFQCSFSHEMGRGAEYKVIEVGALSGLLVTALPQWTFSKTWSEDHHYKITVYKSNQLGYAEVISYTTPAKYEWEQPDQDAPKPLEREMPTIKKLIASVYGKDGPAKLGL